MKFPEWSSSKWFRWFLLVLGALAMIPLANMGLNQLRGRSIVDKVGLPELPPDAWVEYAFLESHDLFFEQVALGFTAPSDQMEDWMRQVENWEGEGTLLDFSLREWDMKSGASFSATISHK